MRLLIPALLIASVSTAFAFQHNLWEPPFYDGVAAQVEKTQITYDDIRREMAPFSGQIKQESKDQAEYNAKMGELSNTTEKLLIERALLVTEFKGKGFKVPAKDSDDEYHRELKENFKNSTSELVSALQAQGMTLPAFRKLLEEKMMVQALQEHFRHELPEITPDQIATYYKDHSDKFSKGGSVKLSAVTLKPMADEPPEVLAQTAKDIKDKAVGGEDFAQLGTQYNQEGSIDWGWINIADLSPEVTTALKDIKPGEIADPVTLSGPKIILIKMEDRHNEGVTPLKEVSESIKKDLFETQAKAAYDKWLLELRNKYYVKVND